MTAISLAPSGLAIVWGFMGAAFWILLIALIVLLVREMRNGAPASGGPAVRLLEQRYARGEISREEFVERRALLDGTSPAAPGDASR
jgi:putative membrane protein